jgi:hypothetical protein
MVKRDSKIFRKTLGGRKNIYIREKTDILRQWRLGKYYYEVNNSAL